MHPWRLGAGTPGMAGAVCKGMRHSPKRIGLMQAAGLAAYVMLFATLAYQVRTLVEAHTIAIHPIAGITLFLLAFVISALISGSIILAYPTSILFDGRKGEALKIVFWSATWLILLFLLAAIAALSLGLGGFFR